MPLAVSLLLFIVFVANVVTGATAGRALLGDVGEMLLLFAASAAFVVAILKREADRSEDNNGA